MIRPVREINVIIPLRYEDAANIVDVIAIANASIDNTETYPSGGIPSNDLLRCEYT